MCQIDTRATVYYVSEIVESQQARSWPRPALTLACIQDRCCRCTNTSASAARRRVCARDPTFVCVRVLCQKRAGCGSVSKFNKPRNDTILEKYLKKRKTVFAFSFYSRKQWSFSIYYHLYYIKFRFQKFDSPFGSTMFQTDIKSYDESF